MTDKARELLERAYQYIPMSSVTSQEIRAYLAEPEVKREALSDEEIIAKNLSLYPAYASFYDGVRWAEKHHGISSTIPSLNDTISANSRNSGHE